MTVTELLRKLWIILVCIFIPAVPVISFFLYQYGKKFVDVYSANYEVSCFLSSIIFMVMLVAHLVRLLKIKLPD